jgi:hypothetical protein
MATKQKQEEKAKVAAEVGVSTKQAPREVTVREGILEKYKQIETGYIDLAQLMSEAYHREYHLKWGFKDFREFCDSELGMHYRKALYLVDIWDKVKTLNLSRAKVEKLGWTKMKDIAQVVTAENAKEWMDKAEKMTTREVSEAVKVSRSPDRTATGTVPHITTMTLKMSEAETRVVMEAVEEAKKMTQSDNTVVALEMICQDWLEAKGVAPERTTLEDHVAWLQTAYGVDITWKAKTVAEEEKAEEEKTEKVLEKADKKAKARKKSGEEPPAPEEAAAPAREQDINSLLGLQ